MKSSSLKRLPIGILLTILFSILSASIAWGAELVTSGLSDNSEFLLTEISQDIANAKSECEVILKDFPLESQDLKAREEQIAQLLSTASEDAGQ